MAFVHSQEERQNNAHITWWHVCHLKRTHVFGIQVSKTVKYLWEDALTKKMKNVKVAFKILSNREKACLIISFLNFKWSLTLKKGQYMPWFKGLSMNLFSIIAYMHPQEERQNNASIKCSLILLEFSRLLTCHLIHEKILFRPPNFALSLVHKNNSKLHIRW